MGHGEIPAIAGGEPVRTTPLTRARRYGEDELQELREALEQETLFCAQGAKTPALEQEFAEHIGAERAVACSSGTAALHAALIAEGISPGDEVITTPITDMGTVIPILFQGAVPVFADLHPGQYNLLPESVEERVTERTRAVIAVHLAGNACDLAALKDICAHHGLALVEDCAQAHGCRYEGRSVGVQADYGCFSLNEFKHISCGDGGMAIGSTQERAARLRLAVDKAYSREPGLGVADRAPTFLAGNYRMTELQAAVGRAQLRKLDSIVERRRAWCGALSERLAGTPGIRLPEVTPGCEHSWWFYMLRVVPEELGADADGFVEALGREGIPAGAHYTARCVYEYPVFTEHSAFARGEHAYQGWAYAKGLCPTAEEILETCVIIPVNEGYTETDLGDVVTAVRRVAEWFVGRA